MAAPSLVNDHVKEEVEGSSAVEESIYTTDESASFQGKLDLSKYGFSRAATLRRSTRAQSMGTPPPIKTEGNEDESSVARRSPLKRSLDADSRTPSPRRRKKSTGYAPPSTYSHLAPLPDTLEAGLICVFIGLNPGIQTATTGHAYAHPSNYFWHLLWTSGLTPSPSKLPPSATSLLPAQYSLGNTNIVSRPSRNGAELKTTELDAGVSVLEEKIAKFRPESVCIVGKSIWESIWRVKKGRKIGKGEFRYGWQDEEMRMGVVRRDESGSAEGWEGAKVFVATTTSALAAGMRMSEKEEIWKEIGGWVQRRRVERLQESEDVKDAKELL